VLKEAKAARVGQTIGVEEEFHLVNPETGLPVSGAEQVLAVAPRGLSLVQQEFQRSMIETATEVCTDLPGLRAAVINARARLIDAADLNGFAVAAVGAVPGGGFQLGAVFPDERYRRISDEYRHLAVEQQVCACQVQVGVPDKDLAVRSIKWIRGWLPVLLALSGGSPFFQLADTGYSSYRNIVTTRWPTGGPPPAFAGLEDYERRLARLIDAGVISDPGMIYYDIRPSNHYPTLEIRIADACPLADDVITLAALSRALVITAARAEQAGGRPPNIDDEMLRAATWKAARSGLTGQLIDPVAGQPVRAVELARQLVSWVRDALDEAGETEVALEGIEAIEHRGTSAQRQRRILSSGKGFEGVVASVTEETRQG
jgi:carboxylate-amine ligase